MSLGLVPFSKTGTGTWQTIPVYPAVLKGKPPVQGPEAGQRAKAAETALTNLSVNAGFAADLTRLTLTWRPGSWNSSREYGRMETGGRCTGEAGSRGGWEGRTFAAGSQGQIQVRPPK